MTRRYLVGIIFVAMLIGSACGSMAESVEDGLTVGTIKKLHGGFLFTEGPAVDADGSVFFTDIPNNRIHKWTLDGKLETVREDSGGTNGLMCDAQGNLLMCEMMARRVTLLDAEGNLSVLAERYQGKRLNSPNDLWIDERGGVYFTDPRYGGTDDLEQDGRHVYYLSPDRKALKRVVGDLVNPNGLIGTADGKRLYVADHGDAMTFVYDIQPDGSLSGKRLFAPQGSDGVALDERGNLYLTDEHVNVYSPSGEPLETIQVPEPPANVTFGGPDRKTLYITARTSLYGIAMKVRGQEMPIDRALKDAK